MLGLMLRSGRPAGRPAENRAPFSKPGAASGGEMAAGGDAAPGRSLRRPLVDKKEEGRTTCGAGDIHASGGGCTSVTALGGLGVSDNGGDSDVVGV